MQRFNDPSVLYEVPVHKLSPKVKEARINPNFMIPVTAEKVKEGYLYMKKEITVMASSYHVSGNGGEEPIENFALTGEMALAYAWIVWAGENDANPVPSFVLRSMPSGSETGYGEILSLADAKEAFAAVANPSKKPRREELSSQVGSLCAALTQAVNDEAASSKAKAALEVPPAPPPVLAPSYGKAMMLLDLANKASASGNPTGSAAQQEVAAAGEALLAKAAALMRDFLESD